MNDLAINLSRESIHVFVCRLIESMGVPAGEIQDESSLLDLGLDSLDVVELSQGIKKQLFIPVSPSDFADVKTVVDAVGLVASRAGLQ